MSDTAEELRALWERVSTDLNLTKKETLVRGLRQLADKKGNR